MTKPNHKTYSRYSAEALNLLFTERAFEDQRGYYEQKTRRNSRAAKQITTLRAFFAFFAGLASASATLLFALKASGTCSADPAIAGSATAWCPVLNGLLVALPIFSIVFPVLGAAFHTLTDLYQWDRLTTVYETALENLTSAGAKAPPPRIANTIYERYVQIYALNTLAVMRDEAGQWGQLVKAPEETAAFLAGAQERIAGAETPPPPPDAAG